MDEQLNMTLDDAHKLVVTNVLFLAQHILTETNGGGYNMPESLAEDPVALGVEISRVLEAKIDQRLLQMAKSPNAV